MDAPKCRLGTVVCLSVVASFLVSRPALCQAVSAAGNDRPNVVLIMADDVGWEGLGCYGGTSYATPRLDELAKTGMQFRHGYSMPVCHPTRVTLLTGKYPFRMGRPGWGSFPKSEEGNTLAHVMKRAGYATAVAGKWQLILLGKNPMHPHQLGFDEFSLFGWHEGPRYYQPYVWQNGKLRDDVKDRYGPDVYCNFLIDFIRRNRRRPFLAYYSMALCHDVTDDLAQPVPLGPQGRYDSYKEMVEAMDARVGRLVEALDQLDLREKTLILFTTDNGTPKSYIATAEGKKLVREPITSIRDGVEVRGGKGELTDAGTRVPLLANWKGTIRGGQVVDDLVDFSDFLPTLAELGGAPLPDGVALDGQSFAARLQGRPGKARRWAYSEQGGKCWVRTQRWKLYNDGRLFDMEADPAEKKPVPEEGRSAEAAAAHEKLQAALKSLGL
ncbi:MAG: sulfatase-like hydrolase/transferase [Planctomycetota bacterium]|jgi:arylsulfatase A-like enzyme